MVIDVPENQQIISLDNATIAKLAIAIAEAIKLKEDREEVGPLTRKIMEKLETVESLEHFYK